MKFFYPEDFAHDGLIPFYCSDAAHYANAKLAKFGKVVYGPNDREWYQNETLPIRLTYKALLINIEPIQKTSKASDIVLTVMRYFDVRANSSKMESVTKHVESILNAKCKHEIEKVQSKLDPDGYSVHCCTFCGAKVKPTAFEQVP